jgi:hypothetical protein
MIKTLQSLIGVFALFVLNFGHWYLFEICFFGAWDFHNFDKRLTA